MTGITMFNQDRSNPGLEEFDLFRREIRGSVGEG
jgi:hypothetical protein